MAAVSRSAAFGGKLGCLLALFSLSALAISCRNRPDDGKDRKVTTLGSMEVTAELVEIRGEFPDDPLYNYAYVMKYRVVKVHRGHVDRPLVFIAHYNPHKPRRGAADHAVKDVGGNLGSFRAGDVHRMALTGPLDDHYMGAIINKYFGEHTGPIYWAVWTNRVVL